VRLIFDFKINLKICLSIFHIIEYEVIFFSICTVKFILTFLIFLNLLIRLIGKSHPYYIYHDLLMQILTI